MKNLTFERLQKQHPDLIIKRIGHKNYSIYFNNEYSAKFMSDFQGTLSQLHNAISDEWEAIYASRQ
jgi:hypothetical protein